VPTTLKDMAMQVFGKDYKNIRFSEETQERLHDRLFRREINALKRFNVPISEATIYMSHFVGPEVAKKIYNAPDNVKIGALMDADQKKSNPQIADLTVGEYKKRISTNTKNKQALSFQEIDRKKLEQFLQTAQNQKGERIKTSSVEGQDLRKDMSVQQEKMQAQQTTNILAQAPTEPQVNLTKPKDSNPLLDKVRAG
jgi:FlaA1/EpsC-like NDP-sugar epimerase